jgi:hypothetical protein
MTMSAPINVPFLFLPAPAWPWQTGAHNLRKQFHARADDWARHEVKEARLATAGTIWWTAGLWLGLSALGYTIRLLTGFRRPPPRTAAEHRRVRALIQSLERPMLRLCPAEGAVFSKLGGEPDMPPDLAWPTDAQGPLAFVAQLDLAEVAAASGPEWLPKAGALYFFFDDQCDRMTVRFTRHVGDGPREPPTPLQPEREFGERRVAFVRTPSRPTVRWLGLHPLLRPATEDLHEAYEPDHRVGGYPSEIQLECLPAACEGFPRKFDATQTVWRLLLQVDADDELGMVWIDSGRIYVLVRETDALIGDFSKTRTFLQFH